MNHIRIEKIADMVEKGVVLADIGTDHALLPIMLVKQGKCRKVYACDIAEGPLKSAKENIDKNNLSDFIQPVLSNGLQNVHDDVNAIVIAGMGYTTAKEILEYDLSLLNRFQQIIVEVNRDPQLMRRWISDHHFCIKDESFVCDRDHDYVIISFTTDMHESYTEEQIELGAILMEKKDPEFIAYCSRQLSKFSAIFEKSHSDQFLKRKNIYQKYLENKKATL